MQNDLFRIFYEEKYTYLLFDSIDKTEGIKRTIASVK